MEGNRQKMAEGNRRVDPLSPRSRWQCSSQGYTSRTATAPSMGWQSALVAPPRPHGQHERHDIDQRSLVLRHGRGIARIHPIASQLEADCPGRFQRGRPLETRNPEMAPPPLATQKRSHPTSAQVGYQRRSRIFHPGHHGCGVRLECNLRKDLGHLQGIRGVRGNTCRRRIAVGSSQQGSIRTEGLRPQE